VGARRIVVVMAGALLLLAGCGGDDAATTATTATTAGTAATATTGSTSTSAPKAKPSKADRAEALRVGFHFYDFPPGWHEVPPAEEKDDPADEALDKKADECMGAPDPADDEKTAEETAAFTLTSDVRAESTVAVVASESVARASAAYLASDKFSGCLRSLFGEAFGADVPPPLKVGDTSVNRTDLKLTGVRAYRYEVGITLQGGPQPVQFHFDFVLVQRGRTELQLSFMAIPGTFDRKLEDALVGKVADRVRSGR
jgi:hypothetical protein